MKMQSSGRPKAGQTRPQPSSSNTPQPEQQRRRRTLGIGRSPPPPLRLLLRSESMLKPAPQALSLPGMPGMGGGGGRCSGDDRVELRKVFPARPVRGAGWRWWWWYP